MDRREALLDIHSAFLRMAEERDVLQDTHGNLSFRYSDDEILIKPSGVPYRDINVANVSVIKVKDRDYEHVSGLKPSVDLQHHIEIYIDHPEIRAICHTHSPNVVAHTIVNSNVSCCTTEQADYFGTSIPCRSYRDLDSWGNDVSDWLLFQKEQNNMFGTFCGHRAVLMEHHGALTFSDSPMKAVNLAVQLENVARKNVIAGMLDVPLLQKHYYELKKEEIEKWHRRYNESYGQR